MKKYTVENVNWKKISHKGRKNCEILGRLGENIAEVVQNIAPRSSLKT